MDNAIKAGRRRSAADMAVGKAMRDDFTSHLKLMRGDLDDFEAKMSDYLKALGFEDEDGDGAVSMDEAEAQAEGEDAVKAIDLGTRVAMVSRAVREALEEMDLLADEEWGADGPPPVMTGKGNAAPVEICVYEDAAVACLGDGEDWQIPYTIEAGTVVLGDPDDWQRVEKEWRPVAGAAGVGDDGEGPQYKAAHAIKAITTPDGEEVLIYPGEGVKALGEGWTGGYLVRFGGEGDLSQWRDIFTPATDFGTATKSAVWVHHRMLPGLGKRRAAHEAEIGMDEVGVFIKHLLDMRDPYEAALYRAAAAGKLGWSSGTAPHLVERKALSDGRHEVLLWPLGLDASYTPTPAGGLEVTAKALKTTLAALGLDIDAGPEAPTDDGRERPDGAKADDDAARRLALELDLLDLETQP